MMRLECYTALKTISLLLLVGYSSCSFNKKEKDIKQPIESSIVNSPLAELTHEQENAFDALNWLQMSTDKMNHFYSTFPNIKHSFYPADTSYKFTQEELLVFMRQFIETHCQDLKPEVREDLATSSVLAQDNYRVLHCLNKYSELKNKVGLPTTGVWVIPNVLERRDLVFVW